MAPILSSTGQSCGTTGFMEIFDLVADVITRNNVRKGALKIDLHINHPDIIDFIKCKDNTDKLNRMNISVLVTDEFMNAVENDKEWILWFPDYENNKKLYDKEWDGNFEKWREKDYPIQVYKKIPARELYNMIMEHAWLTGEPGISFLDHMNKNNPNPHLSRVESTNPCSEFSSIPYNSCNLGSINLYNMVENKEFNWDKLEYTVNNAVRFLDNMITVNQLPLEEIERVTKNVRSVGLGIMGYADMLYELGIPYNSQEAIEFTDFLMNKMWEFAKKTSINLAEEKGIYSAWKGSLWEKKGVEIRNSNLLSIAPTGSISFIAGVSGGLEPNFALVYERTTNEGDKYFVVNQVLEKVLKKQGLYSKKILKEIYNNGLQNVDLPKEIKKVFVTANDLTPKEHLDILEVFSNYVDLSASKTVNLPNEATVEDVADVYLDTWKRGIKCITIYRDGSRIGQVLSTGKNNEQDQKFNRGEIIDAQDEANSKRFKLKTGCGTLYLIVVFDDEGNIIETFTETKNGGCKASTEGLSRMNSLALRGGISIDDVIDQLMSVSPCMAYQMAKANGKDVSPGTSCPNAVGLKLKEIIGKRKDVKKDFTNAIKETKEIRENKSPKEEYKLMSKQTKKCPECGEKIMNISGCVTCPNCGWSKCG